MQSMSVQHDAPVGRGMYSLAEFLQRNNISAATYYKMKRRGLAPREVRFGTVVRISADAEREWIRKLEAESDERSENAAMLRRRAQDAVAKAGHVTARRAEV